MPTALPPFQMPPYSLGSPARNGQSGSEQQSKQMVGQPGLLPTNSKAGSPMFLFLSLWRFRSQCCIPNQSEVLHRRLISDQQMQDLSGQWSLVHLCTKIGRA